MLKGADHSIPAAITDFCKRVAAEVLRPDDARRLHAFMIVLIREGRYPPRKGRGVNWQKLAEACGIAPEQLSKASAALKPGFAALMREIARRAKVSPPTGTSRTRGCKPKPLVEHPTPLWDADAEPSTFAEALSLQMRRHGESYWYLHRAIRRPGEIFDRATIRSWQSGLRVPRSLDSLEMLARIEHRYRLPEGYLKSRIGHQGRAAVGHKLVGIGPAEQRRLAWHLPDDFHRWSFEEQEEILDWVRTVIIKGSTDYRRFQAEAIRSPYGIRFPGLFKQPARSRKRVSTPSGDEAPPPTCLSAPPRLMEEMQDLLRFKTATLTKVGYQRSGVWGDETAAQKIEHFGLMLGALAAAPNGSAHGLGVPLEDLSFALLMFPSVWDWYLQWREKRRGFFTGWEVEMLTLAIAFSRRDTGWLRQSPWLAERLRPVPWLVGEHEVEAARQDWHGACDALHKHAIARAKEIGRIARVHRDPFEPILPILEAESPLREYRKIAKEIEKRVPNEQRYPVAAAEAVRAILLLRVGLHLGVRQKNLRQLGVCLPGNIPASERRLADEKRGELRWHARDAGWEVFIPSVAFKNAHSSFFSNKPFRLLLPDLDGLYGYIDAYLHRHRPALLHGAQDPGTFFVKTVKQTTANAAYDQNSFYEVWRLTIQRYGIFNPYTGRGAIPGLLPHGPHNLRDVLATHILKQTGSYEQASYAIQDTPEIVARHYGRFLPQDKAAIAAQILNKAWEAA